jgi:hypothetical protein
MRKVVGISQKTKRAWLDAVLDCLAKTNDEAELRRFLDKHLKDELPGKESRAKSTGIILRIWSSIPPERIALRDKAVALLPRISGQERIWLHWGMTALAYPFFRDTAEVVGRLLSLQDDFTTAQVQGRMLTTWGDRATSKEAAQKLVTSLVDWEVLRSTKVKGHFLLARKMTASIPDLQLWLLEALLHASDSDEIEAQQLLRLPESFPFSITVGLADLRRYEGFNIHRQGLDMDLVVLRKVKLEPPPKFVRAPKKPKAESLFLRKALEGVSNNEKSSGVIESPVAKPPPVEQTDGMDERCRIKERLKDQIVRSLLDLTATPFEHRHTNSAPQFPFAAASSECVEQLQRGHYFGCIALGQSVLQFAVRHVWQTKFKKKSSEDGGFENNLDALHKKKYVSDESKIKLEQVWEQRDSFLRLNPKVESEKQRLEELARRTYEVLSDFQSEFFGAAVVVETHLKHKG